MKKRTQSVRISISLFAMALILMVGGVFSHVSAKPGGAASNAVIVLTASWCGTCREVVPVVTRVVQEIGMPVITLDVDDKSAVEKASQYGINVSGADVPQVYISKGGKTSLVFSGKGYKFGKSQDLENQIRTNIRVD